MAEARRALGVAETTTRPRRAQTTLRSEVVNFFGSFQLSAPRGRYARDPWYTRNLNLSRIATVGGVGALAVGVAAFTFPVATQPTLGAEVKPMAAISTPHTILAGVLEEPGNIGDELTSQLRLYATTTLSVRSAPKKDAKELGTLNYGDVVYADWEVKKGYRAIDFDGEEGWVLDDNLSKETAEFAAATSLEPCYRGSAVENKLRADTIKIYRSICPLFPEVNSYGGWRAGGRQFHKNGRALDIMLTPRQESALGWRIAEYLTSHAREFNIDHVIFEQKIWTPNSPHWRHMADRGGTTANHYDHVHVAVRA